MTKIFFWNVQRLGKGSDLARTKAIKTVIKSVNADLSLFCELTRQCGFPASQNLTYRKEDERQLCYGCLDAASKTVELDEVTPLVTDAYTQAGYKGGTNFRELTDRAVGHAKKVDGVEIYVIHAKAQSSEAEKIMAFLACYLDDLYKTTTPWLVIGDFNVIPEKLKRSRVGINLNDLMRYTRVSEPTYIGKLSELGRSRVRKRLDYALTNITDARVSRIRCSPRLHNSDHFPIVAEW
jgi:endonuclease/exonuclease/phosphatase family metal-dependent hydrolase